MKDKVDEKVARWQRELPGLDGRVVSISLRMRMLVRHLSRQRKAALAAHGLQDWEFDTLNDLRRRGEPYRATPSEVAEALSLTPAAMTRRLDGLTGAGYVLRAHDTTDRRRIYVTLTPLGHRVWQSTVDTESAAEKELIGHLTPAQQDRLNALLRTLLIAADEQQPGPSYTA